MTNGNDYIEQKEKHYDEILEAYITQLRDGQQEVPEEFVEAWIEGGWQSDADDEYDRWRDSNI